MGTPVKDMNFNDDALPWDRIERRIQMLPVTEDRRKIVQVASTDIIDPATLGDGTICEETDGVERAQP